MSGVWAAAESESRTSGFTSLESVASLRSLRRGEMACQRGTHNPRISLLHSWNGTATLQQDSPCPGHHHSGGRCRLGTRRHTAASRRKSRPCRSCRPPVEGGCILRREQNAGHTSLRHKQQSRTFFHRSSNSATSRSAGEAGTTRSCANNTRESQRCQSTEQRGYTRPWARERARTSPVLRTTWSRNFVERCTLAAPERASDRACSQYNFKSWISAVPLSPALMMPLVGDTEYFLGSVVCSFHRICSVPLFWMLISVFTTPSSSSSSAIFVGLTTTLISDRARLDAELLRRRGDLDGDRDILLAVATS